MNRIYVQNLSYLVILAVFPDETNKNDKKASTSRFEIGTENGEKNLVSYFFSLEGKCMGCGKLNSQRLFFYKQTNDRTD